jgi:hypothetical protein
MKINIEPYTFKLNNYEYNWTIFEHSAKLILNSSNIKVLKSISYEEMYRSVYNMVLHHEIKFHNNLGKLLNNYDDISNENIKCLNDILMFYTRKTGYKIKKDKWTIII